MRQNSKHKHNETNSYLDSKMRSFEDEAVKSIRLPNSYHTVKNFHQTICQYLRLRGLNKLYLTKSDDKHIYINRKGKDAAERKRLNAAILKAQVGDIIEFDAKFKNIFGATAYKKGKRFRLISERGADKAISECIEVK